MTLGLEAACAGERMARSRSESREAWFPLIPVKVALGSAQPKRLGFSKAVTRPVAVFTRLGCIAVQFAVFCGFAVILNSGMVL